MSARVPRREPGISGYSIGITISPREEAASPRTRYQVPCQMGRSTGFEASEEVLGIFPRDDVAVQGFRKTDGSVAAASPKGTRGPHCSSDVVYLISENVTFLLFHLRPPQAHSAQKCSFPPGERSPAQEIQPSASSSFASQDICISPVEGFSASFPFASSLEVECRRARISSPVCSSRPGRARASESRLASRCGRILGRNEGQRPQSRSDLTPRHLPPFRKTLVPQLAPRQIAAGELARAFAKIRNPTGRIYRDGGPPYVVRLVPSIVRFDDGGRRNSEEMLDFFLQLELNLGIEFWFGSVD